jgi:calcineurin-like phosphoesterase family protein
MKVGRPPGAIFLTADTHFDHENIVGFCERPFSDVNEMNEALVRNWNETVSKHDIVFHLGDFCFNIETFDSFIPRLNGHINIVPGGHDKWVRRAGNKVAVLPPLVTIEVGKIVVVLCHYAMRVWDREHYGSYHCYGHSHGRLPGLGRSMDVGVDAWDYRPITLDMVMKELEDEEVPG